MVMLTLGTGVGGGLILNDRLYRGAIGAAGELGHITLDIRSERPCEGASVPAADTSRRSPRDGRRHAGRTRRPTTGRTATLGACARRKARS